MNSSDRTMPRSIVSTRGARNARQKGVALVAALVILLVVSLISVTGANQTTLGQHMASNHYVQTRSFLAAEAGLTKARLLADDSDLKKAVASGDTSDIKSRWTALIAKYETWHPLSSDSSAEFRISTLPDKSSYWNATKQVFEIVSYGGVLVGTSILPRRTIGARIIPGQNGGTSGASPFVSAVTGRESVSVVAGSKIDTYNSNYGSYDTDVTVNGQKFRNNASKANHGNLAGVSARTCTANGTITLSGSAPIYGDVLGTGNLIAQSGAPIHGNIHVNGNATFDGHVEGNLTVGRYAYIGSASYVGGIVTAGGNVTVAGGAYGKPSAIDAGGTIDYPSYYPSSLTDKYIGKQPASALAISAVTDEEVQCRADQAALVAEKFTDVRTDPRTQTLSSWLETVNCKSVKGPNGSGPACYQKNDSDITLNGRDWSNNHLTIGAADEQTLLRLDGNLSTTGSLAEIKIEGYVTLLVDGTFDLGARTTLSLGPTGTLTLLVTGRTILSKDSNTSVEGSFVRAGADGKPAPAIAVYSTYAESGAGIIIKGDNDAYIAVYAPDASVDIGGSGDIYGSVVGKTIHMDGSGGIHYDEALKKVSIGSSGSGSKSTDAQLASWWQILNDTN